MTVYFDYNASAPLKPEVLDTMLPFFKGSGGNASSLHQAGRFLRSAIESAREQVAALVNVSSSQLVFTSGGSEANNTAIKSLYQQGCHRILANPMEHASVIEPLHQIAAQGADVQWMPVLSSGEIDRQQLARQIEQFQPRLITVQLANNETGVIQPVAEITRMAKSSADCLVHTDATQACGKIEVDFKALGVDLMTLSAHKFGGPQSTGALILSVTTPMSPMISGGPQENGRRAGTENVALLAGFGRAAEIAMTNLSDNRRYLLELRDYFEQRLAGLPQVEVFGNQAERLPNTSFFSMPYFHGETLLMQLDRLGFALASGSACHSEVNEPSHVLKAMGIEDNLALNAVRVSFGMENTRDQVDQLLTALHDLINQLPAMMRPAAASGGH